MEDPVIGRRGEFNLTPSIVTVPHTEADDEKQNETEIELENTFERNGFVMCVELSPCMINQEIISP